MKSFSLKHLRLVCSIEELGKLPAGKLLINTINAHSYNTARKDSAFAEALQQGDALVPDGMSIVKACQWINANSKPVQRIAGWDLFCYEMSKARGTVMFLGSSEETLAKIRAKAMREYPLLKVVTYSPPYKAEFSDDDNKAMIEAVNNANPDLLWIGMTAPKQEKWAYSHWKELDIHCHCGTIGAVFDFYAGNTRRAPMWWQKHGLEWLYRLIKEPRRLWRRYIIGNVKFLCYMAKELRIKN